MNERISDAEFFDHLRKNGVPQKFQDKRLTLGKFGAPAERLNEAVWDYDKWQELTDKYKFINLYCSSQDGAECSALIIRTCLLLGRQAGFVSLRKLINGDEFETTLFESRTIIGIPRFEYAAGMDLTQNVELSGKILNFEELVYDHIDEGGVLVVGSGRPIRQLQGYRKNFLAHLDSVGLDVSLEQ